MTERKIYIAGHRGMVGSAVLQLLENKGYSNLITRSSDELDLRNQQAVDKFMREHQPDVVVLAAARVGGILANDRNPYPFLYENLMIESNVINAAHQCDVDQLVFLGSSCIYPKHADQPIKEEYLLTGSLEPTNQWYAIAKIAGIKLCEALNRQYNRNYVSLMPTNLYGPRDNFDLKTSHVVPAMIRKFYEAKVHGNEVVGLWGTGNPKREFLHVSDMAKAIVFSIEERIEGDLYNVGIGQDISIRELAYLIQKIVGHRGEIIWDTTKPDGTPRKLLDVSKIHSKGWEHECELEEGIRNTYGWYLENIDDLKEVKI
ncbi:GDP-L-fucose synthase [Fodinibius sp. Rm-B-1B1-1]|uniref:GDP-L-fucose synthase family protein n=1 Tax=Fodinibius alkaliphilus TaxID=3140241 RepID=UPI00315AD976